MACSTTFASHSSWRRRFSLFPRFPENDNDNGVPSNASSVPSNVSMAQTQISRSNRRMCWRGIGRGVDALIGEGVGCRVGGGVAAIGEGVRLGVVKTARQTELGSRS